MKYQIHYSSDSAVIFESIEHNFHKESYKEIDNTNNRNFKARLEKPHPKVTNTKEMQSSNSSDALLMNIFSHPKIKEWKGIANLFGLQQISTVKFGYEPTLLVGGVQEPTPTEIDMVLNDEIYCESKLTESDFTSKDVNHVMKYQNFNSIFDVGKLSKNNKNEFNNYQLIRNIIAAEVNNRRFVLICHKDRIDLVQEFINTVVCIKDINLRQRCSIIFWQDIAKVVGKDLQDFLQEKYGLVN